MLGRRIVGVVIVVSCVTCGSARPSSGDEVAIARSATFSASNLASDLISATPQLECVVANGVCNYHVLGTPKSWAGVPRDAIGGVLENGQPVVAVALQSPGNGRGHVFLALLWTKVDGHLRFVGYIAFGSGDLVVTTSVYGPNDEDCCPKHTRIDIETLDGITLRKISEVIVPATTFPGSQFSVPEKL
jgi:hypothetical protein